MNRSQSRNEFKKLLDKGDYAGAGRTIIRDVAGRNSGFLKSTDNGRLTDWLSETIREYHNTNLHDEHYDETFIMNTVSEALEALSRHKRG